MSNFSENLWKFPLIFASARKLEQLAKLNAIPLGGLKTLAEYQFQLYNSITIFHPEVVNISGR